MLTVVFAHGKESGPWGTKIRRLAKVAADLGCDVVSVDFTASRDPEERVAILKNRLSAIEGPLCLVGSSMGGYVVTVVSATCSPLAMLLLAPAFYLPGYAVQDPVPCTEHTVVVHGRHDRVVPLDNVLRFCRRHKLKPVIMEDGHQLLRSLPEIEKLFRSQLQRILNKASA